MATNARYSDAEKILIPVPAGVVSGQQVRVGNICGVAVTNRDANGNATVWLDGSWTLQVNGAVASIGLPVYIKPDGTLDVASAGNLLFGVALGTKAAALGPLEVAPIGYAQV